MTSTAVSFHPPAAPRAEHAAALRAVRRWALLMFASVLLSVTSGCGLFPDAQKDETIAWTADRIYKEAHDAMVDGNYTRAAKLFDALEGRFPYGRYVQQAILEGAYSNYRANDPDVALAACDRFIRTYPSAPNVDYALYLKGLVRFREDQGLLGYVYELDLSERDPKAMKESYGAFKELVSRFPDSRYAEDSRARLKYLSNALAMYEVHVARYYYGRGAYLAAANRAQSSLLLYPENPANEDALDVLVNAYDKMNLPLLRDDSKRVLAQTYPNSRYVTGPPPSPWWKIW